jgi:uncharacterized membrane protein
MSSIKAPLICTISGCLTSWALAFAAMSAAPPHMPIHWNWAGEPDGYSTGAVALIILPVLQIQLVLVLHAIVHAAAPPAARRPAAWIISTGAWSFTWLQTVTALRVWGVEISSGLEASVAVALPLAGCGILFPRIPPNTVFGIRIRPTLRDERVWYSTHRWAARWFLVGSFGLVITGFTPVPIWASLTLWVGGPVIASVIYAYTVRRSDDNVRRL